MFYARLCAVKRIGRVPRQPRDGISICLLSRRGPIVLTTKSHRPPRCWRQRKASTTNQEGTMARGWCRLPLLVGGLFVVLPGAAPAQDYPSKSIRIVVPNPPGGSGDISARLVGQRLSEAFKQNVVIENQPGASGAIAMNMVKRAPPDGYLMGVTISLAQTVDRIQNKTSSFNLASDFTPITALANNPVAFLANDRIESRSMAEFIELVRRRPGEISYSSPGIGTAHHLYGEVLNRVAGIKMINVPYKGVTPALNDLLGGHVPVGIISLSAALPHVLTGKLRALAIFDAKRHPKLPDVPLIQEVLPKYELGRSWVGLIAPPDLPPAITSRLNQEVVRILRSPEVEKTMSDAGLEVVGNSSAEFGEMIRRDTRLWDEAAAGAGLFTQ
jgi:tripartite-type tricarboxylate transporter receptor subunit TctC